MVQSVLGSLVLGYRPLWNAARKLAGVQLYVHSDAQSLVDAPHLLRTISELWTASSPPLLLSPRSLELLTELLEHAPPGSPWIAISGRWLADPAVARHARSARSRGLRLVWDGPLDHLPDPETASLFDNSLLQLSSQDAVVALRASTARGAAGASAPYNPVIAEQMYDNVASRALLAHCLDHSRALAVAGWPCDDVLHSLRHQQPQPSHEIVHRLMKAIDQEHSIDSLEQILSEDPLLAYRFMTYTNSAALGLRSGVDSLRRALVMMGYGSLSRWLGEMLPYCSTEPDLRPIRIATVLRARLTEQLMNAGEGKELRREVYLCGLFSQLGDLLRESLGTVLRRLPLSDRVYNATVMHTGPYAPCLDMACALEGDDASVITGLCETHELELEEINRALLRVLSEEEVERPGQR